MTIGEDMSSKDYWDNEGDDWGLSKESKQRASEDCMNCGDTVDSRSRVPGLCSFCANPLNHG